MQNEREYILSKQFLKSATSIGANIAEALGTLTGRDFIAKMAISCKEARETLYWVELIEYGKFIDDNLSPLKAQSLELIKTLTSITKTAQQKYHPKSRL